jgi:hypothetical protein
MFVIWPMDRPYWWKSHLFCDLSHGQGDRHYSISRNFMAIIPLYKWKIYLNKHYWSIRWWLVSYSGPNWWHILCIRNAMNDVIWWCHLIIQWHITRVHADIATAGDIEKQAGNMWTHEVISCFGMNTNIHCHTSMVSHEHITTLTNRKNERVSRL